MRERLRQVRDYWTDDTDEGRRLRRLNVAFYAWMMGVPVPFILLSNLLCPTLLIGAVIGAVVGVLAAAVSASMLAEHFVETPTPAAQILADIEADDVAWRAAAPQRAADLRAAVDELYAGRGAGWARDADRRG